MRLIAFLVVFVCLALLLRHTAVRAPPYIKNPPHQQQHTHFSVSAARIITIPRRMERARELYTRTVRPHVTDSAVWDAVTKESINISDLMQKGIVARGTAGERLNVGEVACYLSHTEVLRHMLTQARWDTLLVLEDDAVPSAHFSWQRVKVCMAEVNHVDRDWDLLYLGVCWDLCAQRRTVSPHCVQTFFPGCTHAYIVSRRGAERLLRLLSPIRNTLDRSIKHAARRGELRCYASSQNLFVQDREELPSELGHEHEVLRKCLDDPHSEPS